jgi:P-type E1-E2 ATPase
MSSRLGVASAWRVAAAVAAHSASSAAVEAVPAAVIGLPRRLRPAAPDAVAQLSRLTGTTPAMLTGDNPRAAPHLAAEAGIDIRAGLLPEGKVAAVGDLQRQGHRGAGGG